MVRFARSLPTRHHRSVFALELDDVFRLLPVTIDNMNADVIRRRRSVLEQYIQVRAITTSQSRSSMSTLLETHLERHSQLFARRSTILRLQLRPEPTVRSLASQPSARSARRQSNIDHLAQSLIHRLSTSQVLLRTLSDVGHKLNSLLPAKRELTPLRETFQLNISTTYDTVGPLTGISCRQSRLR